MLSSVKQFTQGQAKQTDSNSLDSIKSTSNSSNFLHRPPKLGGLKRLLPFRKQETSLFSNQSQDFSITKDGSLKGGWSSSESVSYDSDNSSILADQDDWNRSDLDLDLDSEDKLDSVDILTMELKPTLSTNFSLEEKLDSVDSSKDKLDSADILTMELKSTLSTNFLLEEKYDLEQISV